MAETPSTVTIRLNVQVGCWGAAARLLEHGCPGNGAHSPECPGSRPSTVVERTEYLPGEMRGPSWLLVAVGVGVPLLFALVGNLLWLWTH